MTCSCWNKCCKKNISTRLRERRGMKDNYPSSTLPSTDVSVFLTSSIPTFTKFCDTTQVIWLLLNIIEGDMWRQHFSGNFYFPEILKCGAESSIRLTYHIAVLQGCRIQKEGSQKFDLVGGPQFVQSCPSETICLQVNLVNLFSFST